MTAGTIVRSKAGHDKGLLFMVIAAQEPYVLLADGRSRKIEKPKRKKIKHAVTVGYEELAGAEDGPPIRLASGRELTNKELRSVLGRFAASVQRAANGEGSICQEKI